MICPGLLLLWRAGDKPRSFVGSRQWVGAIELGFVLDTLLGVTCRVITVSAGADMPSKAREIAHHFDTQVQPSPSSVRFSCMLVWLWPASPQPLLKSQLWQEGLCPGPCTPTMQNVAQGRWRKCATRCAVMCVKWHEKLFSRTH